jgi:hypothetical protein
VVSKKLGHMSDTAHTYLAWEEGGDNLLSATIIVDPKTESGKYRRSEPAIEKSVRHEFGHGVHAATVGREKYRSFSDTGKESIADRIGKDLKREWRNSKLTSSLGLGGGALGSSFASEEAEKANEKQQRDINAKAELKRNEK